MSTRTHEPIPKDFPVKPLKQHENPPGKCYCGHCGLSWDDNIITDYTPCPSARCPFEYYHIHPEDEEDDDGELDEDRLERENEELRKDVATLKLALEAANQELAMLRNWNP